MAKKHTGKRSDLREEIALETAEALSRQAEEFSAETMAGPGVRSEVQGVSVQVDDPEGMMTGTETGPSGSRGESGTAEAPESMPRSERTGAAPERTDEGPGTIGGETRHRGLGPGIGGFIHSSVYAGFYGLSYSVTFGALLVGYLLPPNSAVTEGLRDGAEAARRAMEGGLRAECSSHDATATAD